MDILNNWIIPFNGFVSVHKDFHGIIARKHGNPLCTMMDIELDFIREERNQWHFMEKQRSKIMDYELQQTFNWNISVHIGIKSIWFDGYSIIESYHSMDLYQFTKIFMELLQKNMGIQYALWWILNWISSGKKGINGISWRNKGLWIMCYNKHTIETFQVT